MASVFRSCKNTATPRWAAFHALSIGIGTLVSTEPALIPSRRRPGLVFLPFTSDAALIDEELRRAAVLVVASYFETARMVVLEAMCRETPVIVSRCGGPDEIVRHGVTGRTFAPGDSSELARLLRLAFERREETRALAVAGRLDVERRYRWSFAVDTLLSVCTFWHAKVFRLLLRVSSASKHARSLAEYHATAP
jgi:glycosyltransferase involved in cell wall biosynthesis